VSLSISISPPPHIPRSLVLTLITAPKKRDITPLIPPLISLLDRFSTDPDTFIAASDALQELMSKSALSDGSGSRILTEPLLLWLDASGGRIVEATLHSGTVDEVPHSLCKLLVGLGDHSTSYIAANIASSTPISSISIPTPIASMSTPIPIHLPPSNTHTHPQKTKGEVSQTFLRLLLAYTGLPGYFGVDEEESEVTLPFWYLFQEALWSTDTESDSGVYGHGHGRWEDGGGAGADVSGDKEGYNHDHAAQVGMAKAVYSELVRVLRRKVVFPLSQGGGNGNGWSKGLLVVFFFLLRYWVADWFGVRPG
jgi:hypothetical protein